MLFVYFFFVSEKLLANRRGVFSGKCGVETNGFQNTTLLLSFTSADFGIATHRVAQKQKQNVNVGFQKKIRGVIKVYCCQE